MKKKVFGLLLLCTVSVRAGDAAADAAGFSLERRDLGQTDPNEKAAWEADGWKDDIEMPGRKGCCAPSTVSTSFNWQYEIQGELPADIGSDYEMVLFARVPNAAYAQFLLRQLDCKNCRGKLGNIKIGADIVCPRVRELLSRCPDDCSISSAERHPTSMHVGASPDKLEWTEDAVAVMIGVVPDEITTALVEGTESTDPAFAFYKRLYKQGASVNGASYLQGRQEYDSPGVTPEAYAAAQLALLQRLAIESE